MHISVLTLGLLILQLFQENMPMLPFSALTLLVAWQERHPARKKRLGVGLLVVMI